MRLLFSLRLYGWQLIKSLTENRIFISEFRIIAKSIVEGLKTESKVRAGGVHEQRGRVPSQHGCGLWSREGGEDDLRQLLSCTNTSPHQKRRGREGEGEEGEGRRQEGIAVKAGVRFL